MAKTITTRSIGVSGSTVKVPLGAEMLKINLVDWKEVHVYFLIDREEERSQTLDFKTFYTNRDIPDEIVNNYNYSGSVGSGKTEKHIFSKIISTD